MHIFGIPFPQMTHRRHQTASGFTLIEMMVGIAVMSLVLVMLLQITGSVLQTTKFSHQRINATQKGRAVLDALGSDLAHRVDGRGLTVLARPTTIGSATNVELAFLSQGRGPRGTASPRFIATDYHLDQGNLTRSMSPVAWSPTNLLQATLTSTNATPVVVAGGIVRFEAVAILDDGSTVPLLTPGGAWLSGTVNGLSLPAGFQALKIDPTLASTQRVRVIVVAVAMLDDQAFALLTDGGQALAQKLPTPAAGETPVDVWNRAVNNGELNSFPHPVVAALHFMQSTYELK